MLKFTKFTKKDWNKIRGYMENSPYTLCDYSLGVMLMWGSGFRYEYAEYNNTLIVKIYYGEEPWFLMPIGKDLDGALNKISEYCAFNELELKFSCVQNEYVETLKQKFNVKEYSSNRKWSDYLYSYEEIKNFVGKKFSGQRNHINKFKSLYPNYKFNKFTKKQVPEIKEFLKEYKKHHKNMGKIEKKEFLNTLFLLDNYDEKKFIGGYITIDNKIVSFTIGEYVGKMLIIHIEKGLTEYKGVYPTTFNNFVRFAEKEGIIYINREDDSGDMGLRTSKLQYQPIALLEKNYVHVNKPMNIEKKPNLKGEKVYLNSIKRKDTLNYYKLYTNKKLNRYWGYNYNKDIKEVNEDTFYNLQKKDFLNKYNMCLAIRKTFNGELIGEVVLYNFTYDNKVEIGIRLFSKEQGKGYGKDAIKRVVLYCKEVLKKQVVAKCKIENVASYNTFLSSGFSVDSQNEEYFFFKI